MIKLSDVINLSPVALSGESFQDGFLMLSLEVLPLMMHWLVMVDWNGVSDISLVVSVVFRAMVVVVWGLVEVGLVVGKLVSVIEISIMGVSKSVMGWSVVLDSVFVWS